MLNVPLAEDFDCVHVKAMIYLSEISYNFFIFSDTLNRMVHGQKDLEALKASFKSIKFCERVISLVDDMNVSSICYNEV